MSQTTLDLTIYGVEDTSPPKKEEIIELILGTLSSAPEITTTLDQNNIDVIKWKLNTISLRYAKHEQVKKCFNDDLIYNGIKNINFRFETYNNDGSIGFDLNPIYGREIDSEDLEENTELKDFNILGKLTFDKGTYGSLDPRFFELAEDIIKNYILKHEYTNNLIGFQGYKENEEIMTPNEFLNKIESLKEDYCNNPDSEE